MKKIVSLVLSLTMLLGLVVSVPVYAASTTALVAGDIMNSVGEDSTNGLNVAFCVTANVSGMATKAGIADYTNATFRYNGAAVPVLEMGVMFTNDPTVGADPEELLNVEDANGDNVICIPVQYLYEAPQEDSCVYVARVVRVPSECRDCVLTARPYITIEVDGAPATLYSEVDRESYLSVWGRENDNYIDMPTAPVALSEDVTLSVATAYGLNVEDKSEVQLTVNFTVQNNGAAYTIDGSYFRYAFYNADGEVI